MKLILRPLMPPSALIFEIGALGLADRAVGGRRPAVRHGLADLDFGVGRAGVVFLLRQCAAEGGGKQSEGGRKGPQSRIDSTHLDLPGTTMKCVMFLLSGALGGPCLL